MINYKNLLFKSGNTDIKNFDFKKKIGTFYNLLNSLVSEDMTINEAKRGQIELAKKIVELTYIRRFTLSALKNTLRKILKSKKFTKILLKLE